MTRIYTAEQMAKKRIAMSAWEKKNKDKRKEQKALYYSLHKEAIDERNTAWQRNNRAAVRRISRSHYKKNTERERKRTADWRIANKDKVKIAERRQILTRDKVKAAAVVRLWRKRHPEEARAGVATNRAKRKRADGSFTGAEVTSLFRKQRGFCAICTSDLLTKFHRDHIVPLKLGGTNFIQNIQLLCQPCNSAKGAKHPIAFMQERGFLL